VGGSKAHSAECISTVDQRQVPTVRSISSKSVHSGELHFGVGKIPEFWSPEFLEICRSQYASRTMNPSFFLTIC
jgi:hypothetical protein